MMQEYMNDLYALDKINTLRDILDKLPEYGDSENPVWTDGTLIYCATRDNAEDVADWIYCAMRDSSPWIGTGCFIHDAAGARSGTWFVEVA